MENLFAMAAIILYMISIAMIVPGLIHKTGIRTNSVFISAVTALLFHFALLFNLIFATSGQNLSILNVASLMSFIVSLTMSLAMLKTRLWFLLPVVYSFSAINIAAAAFLPSTFITHFEQQPALIIHITLALFAYATLTIAALYAMQLAWLDFKLKQKNAMIMNPNLPPLMKVERQLFNLIALGNALLTMALATGIIFVGDIFAEGKAHKAVFSIIAWCIFSILLWGHYKQGWRGKRVTWLSVIGATLLTLAYFGSRFVREIILT
jgi:ABC-type uncharacterized transport system permease subunit